MLRNPLFYRVICLFLVVYQKKYHFCLHVFQNISIFATLFSSVTYRVTDLHTEHYVLNRALYKINYPHISFINFPITERFEISLSHRNG